MIKVYDKYKESFISELEQQLAVYVTIGGGTMESPMWFIYAGTNEHKPSILFKSSQVSYMFFEVAVDDEDMIAFRTYNKPYEYFRKVKYDFIRENYPTVYKELKN